jgi:hypothetical protein
MRKKLDLIMIAALAVLGVGGAISSLQSVPTEAKSTPTPQVLGRIVVGQLKTSHLGSHPVSTQPVSITNTNSTTATDVHVECGFYVGDKLVSSDSTWREFIAPGETAYVTVIAGVTADRAECTAYSTGR